VGFVPNIGCFGTDTDFSGVPYQLDWPGTNRNAHVDRALHPTPISFQSPVFTTAGGERRNYARVAFEANMPRIEAADFGGNCNRTTGVDAQIRRKRELLPDLFDPGRGRKLPMEPRRTVLSEDYRFVRRQLRDGIRAFFASLFPGTAGPGTS